jgi:hypothetical protein
MKRKAYLKDGNMVVKELYQRKITDLLKEPFRPFYRRGLYALIYLLRIIRRDPHYINYIDPRRVTHTVNRLDRTLKRNDMWHFGTVEDGDWDINGSLISEYGWVYKILKNHVVEGKDYYEISEYRDNLIKISNGEMVDLCVTEDEYRQKWQHIEHLYNIIKEYGYMSQKELASGRPFNEIRIQIGRTGNYLLEEGMHRLVIAQVLELKEIPVIITRRHTNFILKNKVSIRNDNN